MPKFNKRDDDLPPGFIGVRGRRSNTDQQLSSLEDLYRKVLAHNGQNMLISPSEAKGMIKKGDNTNVYKDGFLGVRGWIKPYFSLSPQRLLAISFVEK